MSRWTQAFKDNNITSRLEDIFESLPKSAYDPSNNVEVEELARARKILKFTIDSLQAADPEYFPLSIIKDMTNHINSIENYINNYISNENINDISGANNIIDNLISVVKPFYPLSSPKARAFGRAMGKYIDTIESSLGNVEDLANNIISYHNELFDGEESIKAQIENYMSNINEYEDKINEILAESKDILDKEKQYFSDILNHYEYIFGKDESDASEGESIDDTNGNGDIIKGKRYEFDKLLSEMKKFSSEQQRKYDELINQIESLLPGATSTGLAVHYRKRMESYWWPQILNSIGFAFMIIILTSAALSIFVNFDTKVLEIPKFNNIYDLLQKFAPRIAVSAPIIWMAMVFSKRRNQFNRLREEYAHKEAFAASIESYREQIEKLQKQRDDIMAKLINSAIDAISYNAAKTLDGKHVDNPPLLKPLETIMKKAPDKIVEKFSKP